MKNLNEDEIFSRLSPRWEDLKITPKMISNPEYEVWGRAREWEHHQAVCLLAGMIPLSKPYFDILISDPSALDFVDWFMYYPFTPQEQNRLINIDSLLKTLSPNTKVRIQPQTLLAQCKSHISIAQSIPESLITVIEQFGPHPSLNLPNVFTSLDLNPRVFINLKKHEENQKKTQIVIPNTGISARVSPPPKPSESPLAIAKRFFPLKHKEKWDKADAFSVSEIVLLHYEIDPDAIAQQHFSGEVENENSREFTDYLNRYFYGKRQLFIQDLDEEKVFDLLCRSFYSKSLQILDQHVISRTEILEWMRCKNLSFPIQPPTSQKPLAEPSKESLLNYDLKRLDKDQRAKLIVRNVAVAAWKENPSLTLQKCTKSPLVKDAIKLANQVGKKSKGYSDKVIADWIRDLNPNYKPQK